MESEKLVNNRMHVIELCVSFMSFWNNPKREHQNLYFH